MLAMFNKNWSFWGDNRVFILIIGLLVVIVGVYERLFLPVGIAILLGVYLFSRKLYNSKEAWFNRYLDTVVRNIERANNYAIQQLPIGIAVLKMMANCSGRMRCSRLGLPVRLSMVPI